MFDRVFVSDLSFEATFAQNKSCSSYRSLQLLFWPNFKFLYQISRFGLPKSAKNHSISVNWDSPVCAQCTAGPRRWRRHASAVAANLVPREPSYPLPMPIPIRTIPSPSSSSRRAEAEPEQLCSGHASSSHRRTSRPDPPKTRSTLPSIFTATPRARLSRSPAESASRPPRPPLPLPRSSVPPSIPLFRPSSV